MNTIREIQKLNKRELENAVSPEASWHTDYRDTAYVHISGLSFSLTEGDILTIFSQFGDPTYLHLARDKETGKSRGYGWLKYEDQRSTDLAVDNLGGADILGRVLKVDHAWYKRRDDETEEEARIRELRDVPAAKEEEARNGNGSDDESMGSNSSGGGRRKRRKRPLLKEQVELTKLIEEHDEEDPMKEYLVQQKREEVDRALSRITQEEENESRSRRKSKRRRRNSEDKHDGHRHWHHHRHHRDHHDHRHDKDNRNGHRQGEHKSHRHDRHHRRSQSPE